MRRSRFRRTSRPSVGSAPADPVHVLRGPLDPALLALRMELRPHRRRLWLRRTVRRAFIVAAAIAVAELAVWMLARLVPLELAPAIGAAIPVVGLVALAVAAVRARPSLGQTALAVDHEAGLGDRVSSALELAISEPALAGPRDAGPGADPETSDADEAATHERLVRRQRADAVTALRSTPPVFPPRIARRPALVAVIAGLLLLPAVLLPNPQDATIAQQRQLREESQQQARRIEEIARELESKSGSAKDPRSELARELRELAGQLRDDPAALDANLARLGSIEGDLRAQIDPSNEQRAAALASLSRGLSRASTGRPESNTEGDPEQAAKDIEQAARDVETMTEAEQRDLARDLAALESTASQAGGAAATALREAAQSLGQGDAPAASEALDRLADALRDVETQTSQQRDLATAASGLQDVRRNLADAGRPAGQTASGQQGQGQGSPAPGQSPGQGQGSGSPQPGQSPGQGQGSGSPQPGQSPGQGQGQGQGQNPGQGQGQGALGGGGSNARYLGSGISSGSFRGPVSGNKPSIVGPDLGSVFAPFDRLGRPGDPSYVAGTGGDGQTQAGNQPGQGVDNGSYVPYQDVFTDFYRFAQTSLDRSYVPTSLKDFVRDYFSSLDPSR
jgi:hypothetical protein